MLIAGLLYIFVVECRLHILGLYASLGSAGSLLNTNTPSVLIRMINLHKLY